MQAQLAIEVDFPTESQEQKQFTNDEMDSWKTILTNHNKKRFDQIYELFHRGVDALDIRPDKEPRLDEINKKLRVLTCFQGVLVDGLEDGRSFYQMLAHRFFPIGNFIRSKEDLSYTPEPDIVHDLYGHIPFFVDKDYSDFCQKFGEYACEFLDREDLLRQFERFFWFTIEFGLIKTENGLRVFGAGIASSTGECDYALSGKPELRAFDVDDIRKQEFRIDEMQKVLFVIEDVKQLYSSLDELYQKVKGDR